MGAIIPDDVVACADSFPRLRRGGDGKGRVTQKKSVFFVKLQCLHNRVENPVENVKNSRL